MEYISKWHVHNIQFVQIAVDLNIASKIVCRKSHLQIEGFLFGSWRHVTGEQEVNLRLYLCKPIYQIRDFVQVCVFRITANYNTNNTSVLAFDHYHSKCTILCFLN